jgi:ABC-2 type transport system ATP-binding protein
MTPALQYKSVKKTFGSVIALDGIDAMVPQGGIFGVVGPDGAGKSTMMRLAMGIIRADRGEVLLLGSGSLRETRETAGYVPQRFSLYTNLTVLENIRLYGALYGEKRRRVDELARSALTKMGLWEFRNRLAGDLSGGMKQKLSLAVGMIHSPKVLFLDEPTTGVDPLARREFWAMLYELNATGVTVVVSTPYMDEAELCTDLVFLNRGKIIMGGTPVELLKKYERSLLDIAGSSDELEGILSDILGLPEVHGVNSFGAHYHVEVEDECAAAAAIRSAIDFAGLVSVRVEKIQPSIEDLFVSYAGKGEDRPE